MKRISVAATGVTLMQAFSVQPAMVETENVHYAASGYN